MKNIICLIISLVLLFGCVSDVTENETVYSVKEFLSERSSHNNETIMLKGFIIDKYYCPPCPKEDAQCIPCPPNYIVLVDNLTDEQIITIVFDDSEEQNQIYAGLTIEQEITVKVKYTDEFSEMFLFQNGYYEFISIK